MANLVDILARLLVEWPDEAEFICQDGSDYRHRLIGFEDKPGSEEGGDYWCTGTGSCWWMSGAEVADDRHTSYVTRVEWQAAVDALGNPKSSAWSGEGLPPVGIVCELKSASRFTEGTRLEEFPAGTHMRVGGHANFGGHDVVAVIVKGRNFCGTIIPEMLLPIRTPEQIAIEVRSKAITQLMCDLDVPTAIAARAYDKGYRKFEIVDES